MSSVHLSFRGNWACLACHEGLATSVLVPLISPSLSLTHGHAHTRTHESKNISGERPVRGLRVNSAASHAPSTALAFCPKQPKNLGHKHHVSCLANSAQFWNYITRVLSPTHAPKPACFIGSKVKALLKFLGFLPGDWIHFSFFMKIASLKQRQRHLITNSFSRSFWHVSICRSLEARCWCVLLKSPAPRKATNCFWKGIKISK